jgi:hypothetical protein
LSDLLPFGQANPSTSLAIPRSVQRQLVAIRTRGELSRETFEELDALAKRVSTGIGELGFYHQIITDAVPEVAEDLADVRAVYKELGCMLLRFGGRRD